MEFRLVIEPEINISHTQEYKKYLQDIMWQLKHYIGHNFRAKIQGNNSILINKFVNVDKYEVKKNIINMYLDNQAFVYENRVVMIKYHIFI